MKLRTMGLVEAAALAAGAAGYLAFGRTPCLTWGATGREVLAPLPGDELLPDTDLLSTRAVSIAAPPSRVWPWLLQMGSGRGGMYTYDWIENVLGLDMHSVDRLHPEFMDRKAGDVEQLGRSGPRLRVAVLDAPRTMVLRSEDGNWVWAFCLLPLGRDRTRLVSRNRISTPRASSWQRAFQALVMEPGSLIMERKMLLGIKERAESLEGPGRPAGGVSRLVEAVGCVARTVPLLVGGRLHLSAARLGSRLALPDGRSFVVFRESSRDGPGGPRPVTLAVWFHLRGIPAGSRVRRFLFERLCLVNTVLFAGFDGYQVKLWMVDPGTADYAGLYRWRTAAEAEAYARFITGILSPVSTPGSVGYQLSVDTPLEDYLAQQTAGGGSETTRR